MADKIILVTNQSFVFAASKFLGLFPKGPKSLYRTRSVAIIITILMTFFVAAALKILTSPELNNPQPYGGFMSNVWNFYHMISLLTMTTIFITHFWHFSRALGYLGFFSKESGPRMGFEIASLAFIAISLIKTATFAYKMFKNGYNVILYALFTAQSAFEIILYLILSQMCTMLNAIITLLGDNKSGQGSSANKMSRLHDALVMSKGVNQLYEKQVLFTIVYFVIFLINRCYHTVMLLFNKKVEFWQLGYNLLIISGLCIPLMLPLVPCEKLKKIVNAYYDDLYNEMKKDEHLRHNIKLRLYLKLRRNFNFSACGFFNLGYSLVTSIIAATTTYVVILVQFSIIEPRATAVPKPYDPRVDILEN